MKWLISFLITTVALGVFSQNPINKSYGGGKQADGMYKYEYANGATREEYSIKNGDLDGPRRLFFRDGSLNIEENFREGHFDGWCIYLNSKGDTLNADLYSMDTLLYAKVFSYHRNDSLSDFIWIQYERDSTLDVNPFDGFQIFGKRLMTNRKVDTYMSHHGEHTIYYSNGALRGFSQFRNNEEHGAYILYHENGTIATKAQCAHGEFIGQYFEYYPNGSQKIIATYDVNGELTGLYEERNEDGSIKRQVEY